MDIRCSLFAAFNYSKKKKIVFILKKEKKNFLFQISFRFDPMRLNPTFSRKSQIMLPRLMLLMYFTDSVFFHSFLNMFQDKI